MYVTCTILGLNIYIIYMRVECRRASYTKMASLIQRRYNPVWFLRWTGLTLEWLCRVRPLFRAACHYRWLYFRSIWSRAAMLTPDTSWYSMQDEVHIYRCLRPRDDLGVCLRSRVTVDFFFALMVLTPGPSGSDRCVADPLRVFRAFSSLP